VDIPALLASRLVMVTGKGGTGKTSFSAALARVFAERGHRTIVVEVDTFRPALTAMLGVPPRYEPTTVAPRLDICNVTWREALEEWLEQSVPAQRIVRRILDNKLVQTFLDATPGVRETVILSRILTLTESYDRVVVDMPASGHAISLLGVPQVAIGLMRGGPIRERAEQVQAILGRRDTALCIVGLPEEMVVNETVELWERLSKEVPVLQRPHIVLNRAAVPSLSDAERSLLERLDAATKEGGAGAELVLAGRWEAGLEAATAQSQERLEAAFGDAPMTFARLGALGGFGGGPAKIVQQMALALTREAARRAGARR
jgi:anion-transporting  ArsA/GET3 family ATPase